MSLKETDTFSSSSVGLTSVRIACIYALRALKIH